MAFNGDFIGNTCPVWPDIQPPKRGQFTPTNFRN